MKENKGIIKRFWQQSVFRFDELSKAKTSKVQMKATQSANLSLCNNSSRASRVAVALLAFFTIGSLFAQGAPGTIQGRILDSGTGDPMIGVTAFIREANVFGVTDIDGNYTIPDVPPGQHTVIFQMAGYETSQEVINMAAGGFEQLNITMSYKTAKEVVVKAKRVDNTTASLLNKRKKAAAAQDAISSEQISKSPDSDAGDAAKRVTGVTLVGGKYVYIRGLSERYSQILVNNAVIPSPLQNKKIMPLDVFPVSILDNITFSKTFTPDMPGDVAAGIVSIETKSYPNELQQSLSLGVGMNSVTTFKDFNSFSGSKFDLLGYDDGAYALPSQIPQDTSIGSGSSTYSDYFNKNFNTSTGSAIPSGSIGYSYGNKIQMDNGQELGVIFGLNIKESSQTISGDFKRYDVVGQADSDFTYDEYTFKTSNDAQFGLAFKPNNVSSYKFSSFYTHGSEKVARRNDGNMNTRNIEKQILKFTETDLLYTQLSGQNFFKDFADSKVDWDLTYSLAKRNSPDQRTIEYNSDGVSAVSQPIRRYYNDFNEYAFQSMPSITLPFKQWDGLLSKFKVGGGYAFRERTNETRRYLADFNSTPSPPTTNIETDIANYGITYSDNSAAGAGGYYDAYRGSLTIIASFAQVDFPIIPNWRLVTGARAEIWDQRVTSYAVYNEAIKETSKITGTDILPNANLIWSITNNINARAGYSKSINRPDFVEAAQFRFIDEYETGGIIYGNTDLKSASIQNFDLRLEWFPAAAEILAGNIFYKDISNPIESTVEQTGGNYRFTFNNQSKATILGFEFELRKNLGFIEPLLEDVSFLFNATISQSEITYNPNIVTSETETNRPLTGQSEWILNTGLYYDSESIGTNVALLYNNFGERLKQVGVNNIPSIYQASYGTLDFVVSQRIAEGAKLKLGISNILDPDIEQYQGKGANRVSAGKYKKGISSSVSFSYKI